MTSRALLVLSVVFVAAASAGVRVANPGLLSELSPAAQPIVGAQGMVACTTSDSELLDVYADADSRDLPVFVTTDLPLHAFHVLFDFALRDAERTYFYPALQTMLGGLIEHQLGLRQNARAENVRRPAEQNIALLSVPASILDTTYQSPEFAAAQVNRELALIERAGATAKSPTLGIDEDYTQYKPRGHYTISDRLQRYFKAMMFLGRMSFYLSPGGDESTGVELTRRALLLCDAFRDSGPVTSAWRSVYEPTAWMVGKADDLLPLDYLALLDSLRSGTSVGEWVASSRNVLAFIAAAESLPEPRILSTARLYTQSRRGTKGMRLMGQRFLLDSYIFGELVSSKVGVLPDSARLLPMGLDVMAALGSQRARHHLLDIYHEGRFLNYASQLDTVTAVISAMTDQDWNSTGFLAWLYALKLNLEPVADFRAGAVAPLFVRHDAYSDKTLATACGSWTELHHDVLLYSKQVYVNVTGTPPPPPKHQAYVEPKPRVFRQIAAMADELSRQLSNRNVANEHTTAACGMLAEVSRDLARIAQEELDGKMPSERDVGFCHGVCWSFRSIYGELAMASSSGGSMFDAEARSQPMPVVADVATDPNEGKVLEVAVGNPCRLYAVIPFYGKQYLAVGSCFSYYEFTKPMNERMTDAEWQALSPKPPMPEWTNSFVVNK